MVSSLEELHISSASQPLLISHIKQIEYIDPLSFFAAGRASFLGQRVFWSRPSRSLYLIGIGHAYIIDVSFKELRFNYVKNKWQQVLKQSIVHSNSSWSANWTGPILLGGFSFDPYKPKTSLWKGYPDGKMVLPIFMLTVSNGRAWLTSNIMVNQGDHPDTKIAWLEEQEHLLFKNHQNLDTQNMILSTLEINPEQWMNSVVKAAKDIQNGLLEKVVLARELRIKMKNIVQVESVLKRLLEEQLASYIFAIESEDKCFIGASPELLVQKQKDEFLTMCLAGTIARGASVDEDEYLGNKLLNDKKNLHEHAIVVQMIKNAMQEGCTGVAAPEKPALYKGRNVQHLYTPIVGRALNNISLLDMVEKLHPTPALGGYPRPDALKEIREQELLDRGWYGAPIGWIDGKGDGEFAIAIRSGLIQDTSVSLFAGCGIVGDSNPKNEYEETQMKFNPMLSALRG